MKSIVPYTKEIVFDKRIAEICSISLEHEMDTESSEIEGNFIVSGEFKSHEVSVNKESFQYKLPFAVAVTDQVIRDSIDFEITDFTYEVVSDAILKINIEFVVTAEEVEESEEKVEEESIEEMRAIETEEVKEAVIEEINHLFSEENENREEVEEEEERIGEESQEIILDSASITENEFTTYHIHIVSEEDTMESICTLYGTDVNTIKAYNNVEVITPGDKIIIPASDE